MKLGSLTKIRTGKLDANAASDDGQYPFFTCSQDTLRISTYSYDCECVLVAGNGDLNVKYYNGKFDAYQRTYIIENNFSSDLSMRYLYYFLERYVHTLRRQSIGGVIKYIKLENLTEADLPLPNINIQNEIVQKLDRISEIIIKQNQQLAKIDTLVKSRFVEMFGDGLDGEGYDTVESCCANVTGGGTPSMKHPEYYGGDIPFIKSGDVKGNILMNGALSLTQTALDETTAKLVPKDSVIVVVRSATLTHKFMIAISGQPMVINQDLKALEPNERVVAGYLMMAIKLREQHLLGHAQTMLTTHINIRDLLDMKIPVPSIDAQKEFMKFAKQADKSKLVIQKLLEKQENLRAALMQEYFG